ncbi:MAG: SpoIID/LytB domain-containing protein [Myxococcota bacterium]|nr:SpoIID/LytB domain-containing protein [Myxococcota bacterium]
MGHAGRTPVTLEAAAGGVRADGRTVAGSWGLAGDVLAVDGLRVRGGVEVHPGAAGLQVVNRVPLEAYVLGTLGREVYTSWRPETLKAQAVAIRTYALYRAGRSRAAHWHVEASTRGQVYGGADAEWPAGRTATEATRGQILAWEGEPILAAFHSASGGRTASSAEVWGRALPYLVSVDVPDEQDSPDAYWRTAVSSTTLRRALAPLGVRVGPLQALRVAERSPSGRARRLQVRGRDGEAQIEARALRDALGADVIRSTLFEIRDTPEGPVFVGAGHGHGVGMSQWGAEAMARAGASYRQILEAFYPGARLEGTRP